ncbi:MAG: TrkH family potassium uptake protein [Anaerovoracaceae bacterium]|nr:TrkH family potassium uptake protein [Anaerovoracaceae bacterium]
MTKTNLINYKAILRILGSILLIIGISMIIPLIYAVVTGDSAAAGAFAKCAPPTILAGGAMFFFIRAPKAKFRAREGYIVVASCWVMAALVGAFPYMLSGFAENYVDAIFESTSGFTTTGCTAVDNAFLSRSLMLWKAISHWLGGMGILVFVISLLPALGINGQMIARAETPGPVLEKMTFRMSDSAKILYITYFSFTIAEFILLMLSGKMPLFDAVINTMGSISTGGLMVRPEGIAYYDSLYVEIVISVFCILASLNFVLYHYLMTGKISYFLKDIELRAFIIILAVSIFICTMGLALQSDSGFAGALRESFFQVTSMFTTAGYARSPYTVWPSVCQMVLITVMFIGGCAASTSGGIKVIRLLVMLKLIWRGCVKRIHPRSVVAVKVGGNAISAPVVSQITVFILMYMTIFLFSSLFMSLQGLDMETTITATLAMMSNTGASFGEAASLGNFSMFHPVFKLYLSGLMIIGRLELFTIIILFTRNFWGRDR